MASLAPEVSFTFCSQRALFTEGPGRQASDPSGTPGSGKLHSKPASAAGKPSPSRRPGRRAVGSGLCSLLRARCLTSHVPEVTGPEQS